MCGGFNIEHVLIVTNMQLIDFQVLVVVFVHCT